MSKTLTIELLDAQKAYKEANTEGKTLLKNLLGKQVVFGKLVDRIKTFEDVCEEVGVNPSNFDIPEIEDGSSSSYRAARIVCETRLMLIAKVFNEGWVADLSDTSQYKYWPYFNVFKDKKQPSGVGLSYNVYGYGHSSSYLGVRLYFKDSDTAKHVGNLFIDEYIRLANYLNLELMSF